MLNKPVDEILRDSSGKFVGVRSGDETAKAQFVVGDPSYFPERVRPTGKVVRIVCILDHPLACAKDSESVQIIIPQNQVGRAHDIYITQVSSAHNVAPKGRFIATVSTTVETANPEAECQPGLALLGTILERFVIVSDTLEPTSDGVADQTFVSSSFDATSHFETTCQDVLAMYRRIMGHDVDLTLKEDEGESSGQ
jgi:Rab GDP dissociation inhibitor